MGEEQKPIAPKTEPTVAETKPVERPVTASEGPRWGLGSIFWGLLLITIGVLALLNNFGMVSLNLSGLSQLWPLLLVIWGISMLRVRSLVWRGLMVLLVIAVLGFVVWVALDTGNLSGGRIPAQQTAIVAQVDSAVSKVTLSVDAGASKVRVNSDAMNDELRAVLTSNVSTLKKTTSRTGGTERIDLSLESSNQWWISGVRNELDVTMARRLPTALSLKLGAADLSADLSEVKLDSLALDLGAANADVRLGAIRDTVAVTVKAGASSITLHIPKDSGVRVDVDGGVSSKQFEGLERKDEGTYESSNYATARKKVTITGNLGATSFTIDRY